MCVFNFILFLVTDPMSPHASDFGCDAPFPSRPTTPCAATQDPDQQHQQQQQQQHHANLESNRGSSLQNAIRRRTAITNTRPVREETSCSYTEDEHEVNKSRSFLHNFSSLRCEMKISRDFLSST